MKDPEFLAAAEKSQLAIDAMPGEELERTVTRILTLEPAQITKLKEMLDTK